MKLEIGDKLKNGAIILDIVSKNSGFVVLALSPERFSPYVVWQLDSDGDGMAGNYYNMLYDAVLDFNRRR